MSRSDRGGREVAAGLPPVPWFLRSRPRLLVTLLGALALPLGLFTALVLTRAHASLESQAIRQNAAAARLGAEAVQSHFEGLARYVESYARRPELAAAVRAGAADAARAHLRDLVEGNPELDRSFITDAAGVEWFDWPLDPDVIGVSFAHRDWYRGVARRGATYVSEVYLRAAVPRRHLVAIATPIRAGDGELLGYLVGQHTIAALTERLAAIRPGPAGSLSLLDHHGHLVHERIVAQGADPAQEPPALGDHPLVLELLELDEATLRDRDLVTGTPSLLGSVRAPAIGWVVLAQQPLDAVLAPARSLRSSILILSLLCLAGMVGLGFVWLEVVRRHHVALRELQRQKDLLSSMIVHDLRNPLAATMTSIDVARTRASATNGAPGADLDRAAKSSRRLLAITNTLLDVMRMEEGDLEPDLGLHDLSSLVQAKVDEFRPLADAASVSLHERLPPRSVHARVDGLLVGRVVDNLITNAVKHTPPGGRVEVRLDAPTGGRVALVVSDTGAGIPLDRQDRLFQKFGRVGERGQAGRQDVGLGLAFCRMAVELHGGTIGVESSAGAGSRFRVELPAEASAREATAPRSLSGSARPTPTSCEASRRALGRPREDPRSRRA